LSIYYLFNRQSYLENNPQLTIVHRKSTSIDNRTSQIDNKKMNHADAAEKFNKDFDRTTWHDETLWWVRQKRDRAAFAIPEWEALRETASQIKHNVLSELDNYLIEFEKNAQKNGITVHWAADAHEHNEIVLSILKSQGVTQMVKSKSMLTEECHLNPYLAENGVEVVDTDLGERIVQLAGEPPSHIVLPCIHWKKEEIGVLFHKHLGTPEGCADPILLTHAARENLREKFLTRRVAITGVNFAVAETGEFVVCTNEGNADMGAHLADVHIPVGDYGNRPSVFGNNAGRCKWIAIDIRGHGEATPWSGKCDRSTTHRANISGSGIDISLG
jgi:L-lactate utilization protein LutB